VDFWAKRLKRKSTPKKKKTRVLSEIYPEGAGKGKPTFGGANKGKKAAKSKARRPYKGERG